MTENKRFVNNGKDIFQYGEWWCSANGEHCADVIATAINELIEENEQLKSFKQRVFDLIDKTIEEETQIAENIEEVAQETRPYAKAVNRISIKILENLKLEL